MRVLVACEFSGIVRDAFAFQGHDAWSCDLLETEVEGKHYQGDVFEFIRFSRNTRGYQFDLMIAHPPCTHLASSGARWWPGKAVEQGAAIQFVRDLMAIPIPHIAIENPVGIISTAIRKPDQIIQPWQFGHGEIKTTCLWLKGLPKLIPTQIVPGREQKCWKMPETADRGHKRSLTYAGIAAAMAAQWGSLEEIRSDPAEQRRAFSV